MISYKTEYRTSQFNIYVTYLCVSGVIFELVRESRHVFAEIEAQINIDLLL